MHRVWAKALKFLDRAEKQKGGKMEGRREAWKRQRGNEERRNKWVWGFPSLWWIDRANRGSQKEKYKNRRACLPWHWSSLPMYQIESLLFLFLLSPMARSSLLSTSNSFQDIVFLTSLPPSFLFSACVLIHLHPAQTKAQISTSHLVSTLSQSAEEALFYFILFFHAHPKRHTNATQWLSFYKKSIFTQRDCSETPLSFYLDCLALLCIHSDEEIQHFLN